MRKAAFLMAVLLLSVVWVVAQTADTGPAGTPAQPSSQNRSLSRSSGTSQNPQSQTATATGQNPGNGTQPAPATSTAPNTQTTPSTGAASQPGSAGAQASVMPPAGATQTIEGCLSGTPGEYNLTTRSGRIYSLAGDDSLLGDHVGEQVKIAGAENSAAAKDAMGASAAPGTPSSATAGGTPYGSTGTAASQPGAATQTATMAGQTSATAAGQKQSATTTLGSGSRFQVSNVTRISDFCNMTNPH
jgi:hypothetical protein